MPLAVMVNDDRLPIRQRSFLLSEIMLMIMGDNHQYCFSQMKTGKMRMAVKLKKINRGYIKWTMNTFALRGMMMN